MEPRGHKTMQSCTRTEDKSEFSKSFLFSSIRSTRKRFEDGETYYIYLRVSSKTSRTRFEGSHRPFSESFRPGSEQRQQVRISLPEQRDPTQLQARGILRHERSIGAIIKQLTIIDQIRTKKAHHAAFTSCPALSTWPLTPELASLSKRKSWRPSRNAHIDKNKTVATWKAHHAAFT